jgi:AraC family transcriptional regulator
MDAHAVSMHQLQSAVADISMALNEALRDDRTIVAMYLRRAVDRLRPKEHTAAARAPGPRLPAWKVRRVLDHVDANLAAPLRNRELANLAGLSEFHFNVAFRNSLGETPHEFVIRRRMDHAQRLMLSTDMPLCVVATECGLADQAHLSRLFRRVVGESPAAWRRSRMA